MGLQLKTMLGTSQMEKSDVLHAAFYSSVRSCTGAHPRRGDRSVALRRRCRVTAFSHSLLHSHTPPNLRNRVCRETASPSDAVEILASSHNERDPVSTALFHTPVVLQHLI